MKRPAPVVGLVIRFDYLWKDEYQRGRLEGQKDRPCAIVVAVPPDEGGAWKVIVAPITHSPPRDGDSAVEIPANVKAHLGLDDARSWIITTEVNRVSWDDPGIVPARRESWVYGALPQALVIRVQDQIRNQARARKLRMLDRVAIERERGE